MKDLNGLYFMKTYEICGDKEHKVFVRNVEMASLPSCRRMLEQYV